MAQTLAELVAREGVTAETGDELVAGLEDAAAETLTLLPVDALKPFATPQSVPAAGLYVADRRVLAVEVAGVRAREIGPEERALVTAGTLAAEEQYYYWRMASRLYVGERGTTALLSTGTAWTVAVPERVKSTWERIEPFREDFTRIVALHYARRCKERDIRTLREDNLPAASLLTTGTLPTVPAPPVLTYTDATAATVGTTTVGSLGTAPTYSAPSAPTLTALGSVTALDLSSITVPSPPSAPAITYSDATAATTAATAIDALPSAPDYTQISLSLDYTNWTAWTTGSSADAEDPEMSRAINEKLRTEIEAARAQMQDNLNEYQDAVEVYRATIQRAIAQAEITKQEALLNARMATDTAIANARETAATALQNYQLSLARYDKQIAEVQYQIEVKVRKHDADLARVIGLYRAEADGEVALYRAQIEDAAASVRAEIATYEGTVQSALEQARTALAEALRQAELTTDVAKQNALQTLAAETQRETLTLERYARQIAAYGAEIGRQSAVVEGRLALFEAKVKALRYELRDVERRLQEALARFVRLHAPPRRKTIRLSAI